MCFTLCLTGISGNTCACNQRRATTNYRKRPCFSLGRKGGGHESKESVFVHDVKHQSEHKETMVEGFCQLEFPIAILDSRSMPQ